MRSKLILVMIGTSLYFCPPAMAISGPFNFLPSNITNLLTQINTFLSDVQHYVTQNSAGTLNNVLNSNKGTLEIPDLNAVNDQVMSSNTMNDEYTGRSELLENQNDQVTNGSYGIRLDSAHQTQTTAAIGTAYGNTLSTNAQNRTVQARLAVGNANSTCTSLGNNSTSSNVTQQIMQNVSQQLGCQAQINSGTYAEMQEIRHTTALNNVVTAQIADSVSVSNTANRQTNVATTNLSIKQNGLFVMPGGLTLNSHPTSPAWSFF